MQIFDSRGQIKESVARFFRAKGSAPRLILEDVNADADERLWDWQASNGQLALRTRTDADESGASPIVISRQGTTVTAISLAAGALTFNGTPLVLQSRQIMAGTGLTGGGDLSADRTISLSASTISAVNLAMSAVQPGDLANVAFSGDYADLVNAPTIPPDLSALQFLTAVDESTALPNSRMLVAGSNITFDTSTPGQLTIHATGSGGGGAVNAVIGGTGISVDNTDPTEPVVSLSADSQSALALATTAVQPEDLALVAFSGEYADLTGIPSTFAPSAHVHNASDINAGTLADERLSTNIPRLNATNTFSAVQTVQVSGATPLSIRRVGSSQNVNIEFLHDGATRYLGLDASGNLRFGDTSNLSSSGVRVSLEGHTHAYVPLVGGTMTGGLDINTAGSQLTMRETDGPDPNDRFLLDLNGGVASLYTHDSSANVWHQGFSLDVVSGYVVIGSDNYNAGAPPVRIRSAYGFVEIGPATSGSCHFLTDRSRFYFDKEVHLGGGARVYNTNVAMASTGFWLDSAAGYQLRPTQGTYATVSVVGSKSGWAGVRMDSAAGTPNVMFNTGAISGGVYSDTAGWLLYFDGTQWMTRGISDNAMPYCTWGARCKMSRGTAAPLGGDDGDIYFQYT